MSGELALVTGAGGFVGRWLVPALREAGHRVAGVSKPGLPQPELGIEWHAVDLTNPDATHALVERLRPGRVVHLAALASPAQAERDPLEALRANYVAVDGLVEALAAHAASARLLFVSSGDAYGLRPLGAAPVDEATPLAPRGTYAATKAAAECRVRLAAARSGLDVVCARPFNHTGPGRPPGYVESDFASQLVARERGSDAPLRVGNLESVRDFSDVRDVVRAYVTLLARGERGSTYNVCSGAGRSVRELLDTLVGLSRARPAVEVDPERFRPTSPETRALVGCPSRLRALGWEPRYTFEDTLKDVLEDWRSRS